MRRAGIFAILAVLLFAVAGVTFAQEGTFKGNQQAGDTAKNASIDRETAKPESTGLEKKSVPEKLSERPADENRSLKEDNVGKEKNASQKDNAKAKGKGKAEDMSKAEGKGKAEGVSKAGDMGKGKAGSKGGDEDEDGTGSGGQRKVTLCHKGKNTITVGAPAEAAHLRHGDEPGVC